MADEAARHVVGARIMDGLTVLVKTWLETHKGRIFWKMAALLHVDVVFLREEVNPRVLAVNIWRGVD